MLITCPLCLMRYHLRDEEEYQYYPEGIAVLGADGPNEFLTLYRCHGCQQVLIYRYDQTDVHPEFGFHKRALIYPASSSTPHQEKMTLASFQQISSRTTGRREKQYVQAPTQALHSADAVYSASCASTSVPSPVTSTKKYGPLSKAARYHNTSRRISTPYEFSEISPHTPRTTSKPATSSMLNRGKRNGSLMFSGTSSTSASSRHNDPTSAERNSQQNSAGKQPPVTVVRFPITGS